MKIAPECYAICEKENNIAIGAVELKLNGYTDMTQRDDEFELGYWLGQPFGGKAICRKLPGNHYGMDLKISFAFWGQNPSCQE